MQHITDLMRSDRLSHDRKCLILPLEHTAPAFRAPGLNTSICTVVYLERKSPQCIPPPSLLRVYLQQYSPRRPLAFPRSHGTLFILRSFLYLPHLNHPTHRQLSARRTSTRCPPWILPRAIKPTSGEEALRVLLTRPWPLRYCPIHHLQIQSHISHNQLLIVPFHHRRPGLCPRRLPLPVKRKPDHSHKSHEKNTATWR